MMSLSATGINLTVIVDGDEVSPAIERLHREFFAGSEGESAAGGDRSS
jgi:aspartokinase